MDVQPLSDNLLLSRYLSGDKSAISQLIERHTPRVRSYLRMMTKDVDLADDIFQETFIKAVRMIDSGRYTDNGRFLSWVLRIAHNLTIDHFRSKKTSRSVNESEAGYDLLSTLHISEQPIEQQLIQQQIAADIRNLIEELPDEQRDVVKMRYFSDMSFKEIAEQTGVSINTALGRMRYALINIRKMVKERKLALS
ncbi:MAG: sigma-70 family RNA polymerase sigma factor [Rikenellaceae bacterium]